MGYFTYFTEESPSLVNRNNRCSRLRCVNIVPSLHKIYFWENFCKYCFYIDAGDAVQCKRRISEKSGKTFLHGVSDSNSCIFIFFYIEQKIVCVCVCVCVCVDVCMHACMYICVNTCAKYVCVLGVRQ